MTFDDIWWKTGNLSWFVTIDHDLSWYITKWFREVPSFYHLFYLKCFILVKNSYPFCAILHFQENYNSEIVPWSNSCNRLCFIIQDISNVTFFIEALFVNETAEHRPPTSVLRGQPLIIGAEEIFKRTPFVYFFSEEAPRNCFPTQGEAWFFPWRGAAWFFPWRGAAWFFPGECLPS